MVQGLRRKPKKLVWCSRDLLSKFTGVRCCLSMQGSKSQNHNLKVNTEVDGTQQCDNESAEDSMTRLAVALWLNLQVFEGDFTQTSDPKTVVYFSEFAAHVINRQTSHFSVDYWLRQIFNMWMWDLPSCNDTCATNLCFFLLKQTSAGEPTDERFNVNRLSDGLMSRQRETLQTLKKKKLLNRLSHVPA